MADLTYENVLTNAIGYEMFKDDHPVRQNAQGVNTIDITDEETERCRRAAKRVIEELRLLDALNP